MIATSAITVELQAEDGHEFQVYRTEPADKPKGAVVVLQEIFGVNRHIRRVADGYAEDGYIALAPALFDRLSRGTELGYNQDGFTRGRALRGDIKTEDALKDIAATVKSVGKPVGIVGYCWGGSLAWAVACRIDGIAAAVGYYGAQIAQWSDEKPKCPAMLHFGARDAFIPLADVEKIRAAHPDMAVHVYEADHGFNCEDRSHYDDAAAAAARRRTLEFFARHLR